jgi:uncharacterized protein (TIGR00266 family)
MDVQIVQGPGSSAARVTLSQGETCIAEGGSLIAMRGNLQVETATHQRKRSLMGGLKRLIGGESFFQNYYTASSGSGEVLLSATLPGDMVTIIPSPVAVIAEGGAFVTRSTNVEMDMSWQGLKSMFSGESLFWLRMAGNGPLVLSGFGAIYTIDVDGEYIVDTGHILAFEESLNFAISKAGSSWVASFLGGEGLVCKFSGRGKIWCQSHHAPAFGGLVGPLLRARP